MLDENHEIFQIWMIMKVEHMMQFEEQVHNSHEIKISWHLK